MVELLHIMILCARGGTHIRHTQEQKLHKIILLLLCALTISVISVLVHIRDKMMVMWHHIYFLIHWLLLQFDKHRPSLSPCWAGPGPCEPHARSFIVVLDSPSSPARLAPSSSEGTEAWED